MKKLVWMANFVFLLVILILIPIISAEKIAIKMQTSSYGPIGSSSGRSCIEPSSATTFILSRDYNSKSYTATSYFDLSSLVTNNILSVNKAEACYKVSDVSSSNTFDLTVYKESNTQCPPQSYFPESRPSTDIISTKSFTFVKGKIYCFDVTTWVNRQLSYKVRKLFVLLYAKNSAANSFVKFEGYGSAYLNIVNSNKPPKAYGCTPGKIEVFYNEEKIVRNIFQDLNGWGDIYYTIIKLSEKNDETSPNIANIFYYPSQNSVSFLGQSESSSICKLGENKIISNSYVKINCKNSKVIKSKNELYLDLAISINENANKPNYYARLYVKDKKGAYDGFKSGGCFWSILASCTNECSSSGLRKCNELLFQSCGNYDSDSCLEWDSGISCNDNDLCTTNTCTLDGCSIVPKQCNPGYSCNPLNGNCEQQIDITKMELSIATLKDNYAINEQIKLTSS